MKVRQFTLLALSLAVLVGSATGCRISTGVSYGYGYRDVYGCSPYYYGSYYCDPYNDYGYGYGYGGGLGGGSGSGTASNETSDEGHDLIDTVSLHEEAEITEAGKNFAKTYGLSEDRGIHIARTIDSWEALSRKRSRTEADIADFSVRLYGVKVADAQNALDAAAKGDLSRVDAMNAQVAQHWGTSPETSKKILKKWFAKEISAYGISE